jgi:hypothetical protein
MIEIKKIAPKSTTDVVYCDACCKTSETETITRIKITYSMTGMFEMGFHLCDRCLAEFKEKLNV